MGHQKSLSGWAAKGRPSSCPACGSPRIARILYGLPAFDKELDDALSEGAVTLGGCVVTGEDPGWECLQCGRKIHVSPTRRDRGTTSHRGAARPKRTAKRSRR